MTSARRSRVPWVPDARLQDRCQAIVGDRAGLLGAFPVSTRRPGSGLDHLIVLFDAVWVLVLTAAQLVRRGGLRRETFVVAVAADEVFLLNRSWRGRPSSVADAYVRAALGELIESGDAYVRLAGDRYWVAMAWTDEARRLCRRMAR